MNQMGKTITLGQGEFSHEFNAFMDGDMCIVNHGHSDYCYNFIINYGNIWGSENERNVFIRDNFILPYLNQ